LTHLGVPLIVTWFLAVVVEDRCVGVIGLDSGPDANV
jgi:hypothetical protein